MKGAKPQWIEPIPVTVPEDVLQASCGNVLLAEILVRRGYDTRHKIKHFLDLENYIPANPADMPDLNLAASRIESAIRQKEHIGVWGDFDVDGQSSTTLLVSGLQALGAEVIYHIPVRARESHGITLPVLGEFLDSGVQLLLTCDTGITAHEAVDFANQHGVDVIITDHHTLPSELPKALASVNPQRLPAGHPLRGLCGAGCAYKLLEELFSRAGRKKEINQYLDLAALGTVADLAVLSGDNRYIVYAGLKILRQKIRPGLKALLEVAEVNSSSLTEEHISFVLAPRLNAVGRLSDANPMVPFLLNPDIEAARQTALEVERFNSQRKLMCDQVFQAAQAQIEQYHALLENPVLVLSHPYWEAGVIGIVASRLVELYHRPAILIAAAPDGIGRASARSIEGINITSAISENQALLLGFGGHSMAAGFSIETARIPEFQRAIIHTIKAMTQDHAPVFELPIDANLSLNEISLQEIENLDRMAPFGPGNPQLVFTTGRLSLQSSVTIGKTHEHLQLIVEDVHGSSRKVLWWQGAGFPIPEDPFDLAYTVRTSNYRGQSELQIEWIDARSVVPAALPHPSRPKYEELDFRQASDPQGILAELQISTEYTIWQEAEKPGHPYAKDRYHLTQANTLVIWTAPPGPLELQVALARVKPKRIILFGSIPSNDQPLAFLTRLTGLVRNALKNSQGCVKLTEIAAAMGQREVSIQKGIAWLVASGHIEIINEQGNCIWLKEKGYTNLSKKVQIENELKTLLAETRAYRSYYQRADPQHLLETF
ncbi:MAG TPA: single-stranded-DNA-specific exonuclease RecJ [Anaerolineaceae bacterium]|nr:single-stranded-DNA-specific exonuclease RecJ [Anaerolineaceae bacterium]